VRLVGVVFGILLALAPGCGGGSDGSGNFGEPIPTSLAASADTSMTDADLQATCQQLYDGCVAGGVTTNCSQLPATCTATVGEYDTCLSDSVAALGGLPPCSAATRASLPSTVAHLTSQPTSAACAAVQNKCPGAV